MSKDKTQNIKFKQAAVLYALQSDTGIPICIEINKLDTNHCHEWHKYNEKHHNLLDPENRKSVPEISGDKLIFHDISRQEATYITVRLLRTVFKGQGETLSGGAFEGDVEDDNLVFRRGTLQPIVFDRTPRADSDIIYTPAGSLEISAVKAHTGALNQALTGDIRSGQYDGRGLLSLATVLATPEKALSLSRSFNKLRDVRLENKDLPAIDAFREAVRETTTSIKSIVAEAGVDNYLSAREITEGVENYTRKSMPQLYA